MFLRGVLVPIRTLINGTSISQVAAREITYWHVELPRHEMLLAEGAWSESYLDMGNRAAFEGAAAEAAAPLALHPDFAARFWERHACAPQVRGGPAHDVIRGVIDRRAAARAASPVAAGIPYNFRSGSA
jgi:Hint domain